MLYGAHLNIVHMCPTVQCSNLPNIQTRNITLCYNKKIVIKDIHILQDEGLIVM